VTQTLFDLSREQRVNVWLWCAHLMGVEATPFEYPENRAQLTEEERTANWSKVDELRAAGDRFYAKAEEVNGGPLDDDAWCKAMDAFDGAIK
jgi:hypothetical protein